MSVIEFGDKKVEVRGYEPGNLMGLLSFKSYSLGELREMNGRMYMHSVGADELSLFAADMAALYEVKWYAEDYAMQKVASECLRDVRSLFRYMWGACEDSCFRFRLPNGGEVAYDAHSRKLQFAGEGEFFRICHECGGWHLHHTSVILANRAVCPSCLQRLIDGGRVVTCDKCGSYERVERLRTVYHVDGSTELMCARCGTENAFWCEFHERYESVDFDNVFIAGLGWVCGRSVDRYVSHTCDSCGQKFAVMDDQEPPEQEICPSCLAKFRDTMGIAERDCTFSYGFKPLAIFRAADGSDSFKDDGELKIGFELELDDGCESAKDEVAEYTHAHYDGFIYCKEDCSLENGVEFVSQPSDPEYLINGFEWEWLLDNANEVGDLCSTYRGGFHMHLNRAFFGYDEMADAKLVILFDRFYSWLSEVGNRDEEEANHWASRSYQNFEESDFDGFTWEDKMCDHKESRYRAVNTGNEHTIELRLFASSENAVRLRQMVDVAQAIARYARECSVSDCLRITLEEFKRILCSKSLYSRTAELLY